MRRSKFVDVFSGDVSVVAEWTRSGKLYDRLFLVADRDGSLLMAGSSAGAGKHVVLRLSLSDLAVRGLKLGEGELSSAPIVEPAGYLFIVRSNDGRLVTVRSATLAATTTRTSRELAKTSATAGGWSVSTVVPRSHRRRSAAPRTASILPAPPARPPAPPAR